MKGIRSISQVTLSWSVLPCWVEVSIVSGGDDNIFSFNKTLRMEEKYRSIKKKETLRSPGSEHPRSKKIDRNIFPQLDTFRYISWTEWEQTNYKTSFFLIVFLSFLTLSTLLLRDKRRNILLGNWVIASLNKKLNKHVKME